MQSMKGATMLLGSMNRQMNLPALQRIAMEFERENEIMEERQEIMDDAIDEATGIDDEEEGEEIVKEVLDEIGVDLGQSVRLPFPLSYVVLFSHSHPSLCPPLCVGREILILGDS
jgi:charged multivesicular body protein 2A